MTYPAEIRETILSRIADGESLRAICRDDGMPGRETVREWLASDEDFRAKCARAREEQADVLFEDMADIEERTLSGEIKADVARVVLSSRQWRAAKLKPKVYGDKIDLNHGGTVKTVSRVELVPLDYGAGSSPA